MDSCERRMRCAHPISIALLALIAFLSATLADAGTMHGAWPSKSSGKTKPKYGDFDDIQPGTVMFLDVKERSGTDKGKKLYGEPTVEENALHFDPDHFGAVSKQDERDVTKGKLSFDIMPIDGEFITGISFEEGGTYKLKPTDGGDAWVAANLSVTVDVYEVDGQLLDDPVTITASEKFKSLATDNDGSENGDWTNNLFVDLLPELMDLGVSVQAGVTKASVTVVNKLAADIERDHYSDKWKDKGKHASAWDHHSSKWWGSFWDDDYDSDDWDDWDDDKSKGKSKDKRQGKKHKKKYGVAKIWKDDFKVVISTDPSPNPGVIPEPGAAVLLGLGALLAPGRRRR